MTKRASVGILIVSTILLALIGLFVKPIPQPLEYHNFADQRPWLGVPNAGDVLSNIPFALAGLWGFYLLFTPGKLIFLDRRERWPWVGVAVGLFLTAFGSAYYHLAPDNARLVWDRLPMTIVFMSFVAALIAERIAVPLGLWLWPLLLAVGIYSVFQWQASELRGAGDLRLYAGVQIYAVLVALVMLLVPARYTRTWDLAIVAGWYALAKLLESFDRHIFALDGGLVSGHTLKHLAAAMAGVWLIRMVLKRESLPLV
ncbi:MAG TPA: hypothetical protein VHR84_13025 [Terriglobales bacterium]|jgi:hypothetical protein|nr:hypothetical protein [Terriglobales bacterium]